MQKLTFETNAVVRWYYTIDGHLREHVGRYVIQHAKNTQRQDVVDIAVMAPVTGTPPSSTNQIAFVMQGLTIDYDSRFNVDAIGKVLKFSHRDGKKYVFTRKPKTDS